ncbi:MAG TPA: hypothetical protein VM328_08525 [Fimbriimonadaceae bacterium]|nr:hypothetical protein [Fimbriimonadaceae bacterium]
MALEAPVLEWRVRQWSREPWKRWVVAGAAAMAGVAGLLLFQSLLLAVVGFVAILASTADYWMTVRNRIDANGCSVRYGFSVSAISWSEVKRVVVSEVGVKLSPLAETSRLSAFRGVFLRFEGNREEVLQAVRAHIEEDVRVVDAGADGE